MPDNHATSKTKLVIRFCCCRTITTAVIIFSFFLGLSMVGEMGIAAASISTTPPIGGQELEGEEDDGQLTPESCGTSSSSGGTSNLTDGTNDSTTTGIAGANNTSLYENPDYGIQILCPENWVYLEEEDPIAGDFEFKVTFISLTEAPEFGTALESEVTPEVAPIVGVLVNEVPFGMDLLSFADLNIGGLRSLGYEIVSTSLNATLSGMQAWEVVYVDANRTMALQYSTIQGDRAYTVLYGSQESTFDKFLPIARDMITSFTIAQ
jgi:hypothetical protein